MAMSPPPTDSFQFLEALWPDLHEFGRLAERAGAQEPDLAAIRLRGLTEAMVTKLLHHLELTDDASDTHFDRLVQLEKAELLDARLLAKFHTIRKLGNNAAHNGRVTSKQAEGLIEDARSLVDWFCPFMRPDINWLILREGDAHADVRKSTASSGAGEVLEFPKDRIRRIRDEVAKAMSLVDPRVRVLRTPITLRDGFEEQLSDDQDACVGAIESFLADRAQRIFLLKGYAGTGKSFLAKGVTEFLSAQGREFRLAAPTGRAAKVMVEKTGREARTLHGLIYDFRNVREYAEEDLADGSETFKFYAEVAANRDQANTVYIVDEASLISDVYSESEFFRSGTGYLLQDLLTYVGFANSENDRKIIFIGDPAQLPPIGMSSSPALDAGYLAEHYGRRPAEYELTEVLRQKAGSGVIRNVMPLRESLSKGSYGGLRFDFDDDVQEIAADEVVPLYMAARSGQRLPLVITFSNAEAAGYNQAIRGDLFPGKEFVTVGDWLIVTANASAGGQFIANGEFVQVAGVEGAVERRLVTLRQRNGDTGAVETIEVPLIFRDLQIVTSSLENENAVLSVKVLDDYLHGKGSGLEAAYQRALYVDFLQRHPGLKREDPQQFAQILRLDSYFNALRSKFGYAVTCHKAQGGEWEQVFVVCPPNRNPRTADYFRWLYTAMTRSSAKLYLINPPKIRITAVGTDWSAGSRDDASQHGANATQTAREPAIGAVSPQEAFRLGLLNRVRAILTGTGIEIDDVAHYQNQEAFYLRRGAEAARVNIWYKDQFKISSIRAHQAGSFSEEVGHLLAPLVGERPSPIPQVAAANTGPQAVPSRPFLKDFHDRLQPVLEVRGIHITSLQEQQWSQRYAFARGTESVIIDVFYDGRDRFTKCMPVKQGGRSGVTPGSLLPELLEVLTSEVVL